LDRSQTWKGQVLKRLQIRFWQSSSLED